MGRVAEAGMAMAQQQGKSISIEPSGAYMAGKLLVKEWAILLSMRELVAKDYIANMAFYFGFPLDNEGVMGTGRVQLYSNSYLKGVTDLRTAVATGLHQALDNGDIRRNEPMGGSPISGVPVNPTKAELFSPVLKMLLGGRVSTRESIPDSHSILCPHDTSGTLISIAKKTFLDDKAGFKIKERPKAPKQPPVAEELSIPEGW